MGTDKEHSIDYKYEAEMAILKNIVLLNNQVRKNKYLIPELQMNLDNLSVIYETIRTQSMSN